MNAEPGLEEKATSQRWQSVIIVVCNGKYRCAPRVGGVRVHSECVIIPNANLYSNPIVCTSSDS